MTEKKILIVDDEPLVIQQFSFVLEKEGFEVSIARDGEEGLNKIIEEKPGLVLLDVMMPKMNGYQVCEAVKADPALEGVKIIISTAKSQQSEMPKALEAGAVDFITKPYDIEELLKLVHKWLG